MLPKNRRIPRKLFEHLLKSGRRFDSKHFSLRVVPGETARVAVSVSKKISKKAVIRNKIRRRTYSATRELVSSLPNRLFLLAAKSGADKIKVEELRKELAELLLKG